MRGLRSMRRRAGFTVAQLAERLSVTRATIYFWEQGRYLPNAGLLPELAEILGCTIDELFTDPNEEHTPEKEERP